VPIQAWRNATLKKSSKTKILGGIGLFLGAIVLSSCTANFCSNQDKANIAYPYEQGVVIYTGSKDDIPELYKDHSWNPIDGNTNVYAYMPVDANGYYAAHKASFLVSSIFKDSKSGAVTLGYSVPSQAFFKFIDQKVLDLAIENAAAAKGTDVTTYSKSLTINDINPFTEADYSGSYDLSKVNANSILRNYGYLKFYGDNDTLWGNYTKWVNQARFADVPTDDRYAKADITAANLGVANSPTDGFLTVYKNFVNNKVVNQRNCIATVNGDYGAYGNDNNWSVNITEKSWSYAWKKGLFEGLIVYPVAWMVDNFTYSINPNLESGIGQIVAIILVTLIVRAFVLALTFKSTMDQQKTQAIQPELAKLQAKYPNSNSNRAEQSRLAQEQMALYKRNKINPASIFLAMIVQFPVFICVWGALQGSAVLSSGEVLNLRLSDNIQTVLFNVSGTWYLNTTGWWTAFVLFVLMSVFQWLAMMLPQWMNKKKLSKQAKVSANPAADKNTKTMKWVSYGMLIFTIIMGFNLPAAMGVYWGIGALISMVQTVITQMIMNKKKEKRN
jgi:YidC/Oxa1 family membrane protein insertase